MYSIDGVPLKNPTYGWRLKKDGTNPFLPNNRSLVDFNTSGRDGTIQVRGFTSTPTITLSVTTGLANLDDLKQLFRLGTALTLTSDPTQTLLIELVSSTVTPIALAGSSSGGSGLYMVSGIFRAPQVYWRDTGVTTTGPTTIATSGQQFTYFTPSTGPIRDALVCIRGTITNPTVTASNNTYFTYAGTLSSTTYLTFDSTSGRAWTGATAFALSTEVTVNINNGRGPYWLEMLGTSDPSILGTPLIVNYSSASGATITVQGRNSYDR